MALIERLMALAVRLAQEINTLRGEVPKAVATPVDIGEGSSLQKGSVQFVYKP